MARVEESLVVPASLAETWDTYFDASRWPAWVDSFGSVVGLADDYPQAGGRLVWRSVRAGRGEVAERVVEHEPRRIHRIEFSDPALVGEMATTFQIKGEGTEVTVVFEYRLSDPSPFERLASLLFVKGQVRGTVRRSLEGLRLELQGAAGSLGRGPDGPSMRDLS